MLGFVNGDTASVLSGAAGLTTTATASSGVGGYLIRVAVGTLRAANYDFPVTDFVAGTLTVLPAALTITANAQAKVYGAAVPALTYRVSGFVNGDGAGVLSGAQASPPPRPLQRRRRRIPSTSAWARSEPRTTSSPRRNSSAARCWSLRLR